MRYTGSKYTYNTISRHNNYNLCRLVSSEGDEKTTPPSKSVHIFLPIFSDDTCLLGCDGKILFPSKYFREREGFF